MENYQPIYDIAEICAQHGVHSAILCPGSRCAPLTLAFTRHPGISTRTFSDERSAAFVGLGIAQQTKTPVLIVCTSGSAAYNFSPAVAEAWYAQTPLIVFTADRPAAWIDQQDGQAIRQQNIYGQHVKGSWTLPEDYSHPDTVWHVHRIINEALRTATEFPQGPVHINAPFREPFYPESKTPVRFTKSVRVVATSPAMPSLGSDELAALHDQLTGYDKILIVAGQGSHDEILISAVEKFVRQHRTPIAGDIISNFHGVGTVIRLADTFLAQGNETLKKSLRPELVISFGKSVISKHLKLFLRRQPPKQHWHIQQAGEVADTFQSLTKIIRTSPHYFFEALAAVIKKPTKFEAQKRENFATLWEAEEHRTLRATTQFVSSNGMTELNLVSSVMAALPPRCNLHLANSMSVRYANMIGLAAGKKSVHVFANRGTSGIDGCTSTAVGHALSSDVPNFLITGDIAFFYDRNAFWHNYTIPNLRILLLNNHGGIIFSMIDGPGELPEKAEYFVTQQTLNAQSLAAEFGLTYLKADHTKKLKVSMQAFFEFDGHTKIMEMESVGAINKEAFDNLKKEIKKGYSE